jgi:UDP:flavonoid glycosyltransferase YjiC (YdhE family)
MAMVAAWLDAARPLLLISDVSVEIAVYARLMGVPVVVVAMPGHRNDPAHRLGYGLASALLATWTTGTSPPEWPEEWAAKTHLTGAFSRYDGRRLAPPRSLPRRRRVLVLFGTGGSTVDQDDVRTAAAATPDWDWEALGLPGGRWLADPWPSICDADVVVTHGGYNALSEVAAARKPAIVIPQPRPHGEQDSVAHTLTQAGIAVVEPAWPPPTKWPELLRAALARGGRHWHMWSTGNGAAQAARLIETVAEDSSQQRTAGCASP